MKKVIYILLSSILLISLFACGGEEIPSTPENEETEPVYYEGHGIKMEIPAVWNDTFVSYYKEYGEGETGFATLEFMTVIGDDEAGVLTIGVFNEQSWQQMLDAQPEAEEMKIGTSADGKSHYTIRFADTKFSNGDQQEKFDKILAAAKNCSKEIQITE